MRKNIVLGLILPFVLVLSTAGAGFAVWFFGENETKKKNDNTVEVDKYISTDFGELYLTYGNTDDENYISHWDEEEDHYPFLYITQTDISFPSPVRAAFIFKEDAQADYSLYKYSFHYEIALSETFYNYFRLVYPNIKDTDQRTTDGYFTLEYNGKEEEMKDISYDRFNQVTLGDEKVSGIGFKDAKMPIIFAYRSGAIPTSKGAFEDMWNKLEQEKKKTPLVKLKFYMTISGVND